MTLQIVSMKQEQPKTWRNVCEVLFENLDCRNPSRELLDVVMDLIEVERFDMDLLNGDLYDAICADRENNRYFGYDDFA